MKVEVFPHNPNWKNEFFEEAQKMKIALDENLIAVYHIGSTAIEGIHAKPIIDILLEVKDINKIDQQSVQLELLGYENMGEFGIPKRRYFRKHNQAGIRTHHLHAFEVGSVQIERHLAFRDYMISHPEDAHKYSHLKCELAKKYPHDINSYMDGKDSFIQEIDKKAKEWKKIC
ncbi:MAG: GrpB family protein [Nostocales cyanobacterium]|nr:MAG: GrpB family protein [Nostocales cyanobacterium]